MKKTLFFVKKIILILFISVTTVFGMRSKHTVNIINAYRYLESSRFEDIQTLSREDIMGLISLVHTSRDLIKVADIIKRLDLIEKTTNHRIVKKINEGSEKIIFRTDSDKVIVLFFDIKTRKNSFKNEVFFLNKLDHENIIKISDINNEMFYFVQDLAEMDLFDFIFSIVEKRSGLSERNIEINLLKILGDVALALNYLHQRNIVHRDIKPENILLFKNEEGGYVAKLTDFSFAVQISEGEEYSECDILGGTIIYTPPKCVLEYLEREFAGYNCCCMDDIFAFAMVAYITLHRQNPEGCFEKEYDRILRPYKGGFRRYHVNCLMEGARPKFTNETISENINMLIDECWKTNEKERPSAYEILLILQFNSRQYSD